MPKVVNNSVPAYRLHKQSGQAICTLNGRDFLLGKWQTKTSKNRYDKLIQKWLANDRQPLVSKKSDLTVEELCARYWRFACRYYVKAGLPTDEQNCIKAALRPLLTLYDDEPAATFGPKKLQAVRNKMIDTGWTRQTINKNIDRIRRMYRWGVEEELVPETLYRALKAVAALSKGHCNVREAPPVRPVSAQLVASTLPHLPGTVADMVRVQQLSGMRPGEICSMRPCDIDRSVNPWRYVPASHKCEHHDQERVIFLGPKSQQILLPYLLRDPAECYFRPVDSESARCASQHAARKTPIGDGNRPGTNRKRQPKRFPAFAFNKSNGEIA